MATVTITNNTITGTTSGIWLGWVEDVDTGTVSSITNNTIWYRWADGTGMNTTATITTESGNDVTWAGWVCNGDGIIIQDHNAYGGGTTLPVQRTPEQIEADRNYRERYAREAEARAEAQREAIRKANALLLSMLAEHQRKTLETSRYFDVIARGSKRRYRIHEGTHGNVKLLDDQDRVVCGYCGQPNGVPTHDSMLAQMLQIEHDEEAFIRAANQRAM